MNRWVIYTRHFIQSWRWWGATHDDDTEKARCTLTLNHRLLHRLHMWLATPSTCDEDNDTQQHIMSNQQLHTHSQI